MFFDKFVNYLEEKSFAKNIELHAALMLLDYYLASLSSNAYKILKKAIQIVKNEEQFYAGIVDLVSKSVIGNSNMNEWSSIIIIFNCF